MTTPVSNSLTLRWSIGSVPGEHVEDAQQLRADAIIELFHIILTDGSHLYLKADNTVTWQGQTWQGFGLKMEGVGESADTEANRPKLSVINPKGIFSAFVVQKKLDRALVLRIRVLKAHLDANRNIFRQQSWRVMRVASMDKNQITLELRDQTDGQNAVAPARMFIPPMFPSVSL